MNRAVLGAHLNSKFLDPCHTLLNTISSCLTMKLLMVPRLAVLLLNHYAGEFCAKRIFPGIGVIAWAPVEEHLVLNTQHRSAPVQRVWV